MFFYFFLWTVVPGTNCSWRNFENIFGPKKGDLVTGQPAKNEFFFESFS
jgi:hypothetical protein